MKPGSKRGNLATARLFYTRTNQSTTSPALHRLISPTPRATSNLLGYLPSSRRRHSPAFARQGVYRWHGMKSSNSQANYMVLSSRPAGRPGTFGMTFSDDSAHSLTGLWVNPIHRTTPAPNYQRHWCALRHIQAKEKAPYGAVL